ncbi:MAG: GTP-binding protein [Candidatus Zambryskibacteria bacterium]|nr:GTP-binding protein [Candidatus Zambryskibacteria bacterium]
MAELRPPVVAMLGHIDHGKSSLLDYIRKTNIVEKEAGGITQHPSVYEITCTNGTHITFIDTPGHEAFTSIRTRCASVADIAILIVSAEDGVRPQTVEVIKYIKECNLPYLVAITKVDKTNADIGRVKQSLAENEVYVEGYGGNISVVEVSAVTGQGVDDLLDMIGLLSEFEGKTAERDVLGSGVIIESRLDPKRGITAVGIIQEGTVKQGLFAASSGTIAPIRFLLDTEGNTVEELSFSSPVQIIGWDKMPMIGAEFKTFLKKEDALTYAESFAEKGRTLGTDSQGSTLGSKTLESEGVVALPIVLKTDTAGSLEVVSNELNKISREKITPKIISSGVGAINENDVKSALTAPDTYIIGFNTKVDSQAANLAERSGIAILTFNIIYELTDKIQELLAEKEPRVETEQIECSIKVLKIFSTAKNKQVIGGKVLSGTFRQDTEIKIIRRESEIGRGKVKELQKGRVATSSANEGEEFGALIESKFEIAPGDTLEVITKVIK